MRKISIMLCFIAALVILSACAKKSDHHMPAQNSGNETAGHGEHGSHGDKKDTEESGSTKALWRFDNENPKPNTETSISIDIQDKEGNAIQEFDINHEKKMHLIIVSKDLTYFNHIHPVYKGKGKFEISTLFPSSGDYKLVADYIPTGGNATTQSEWISVKGTAPELAEITPDATLVKTVNDMEVTLSSDHFMSGMDVKLNFNLVDAKKHKPITDLQPYLGAIGHVVIMSDDAEQYLHVHPTDEDAAGPDAEFMTKFPKSGVYKIWGQFQRNDEAFFVPFVVKVP